MGMVVLRKGSQYFTGPVFTPFDPPKCVIILFVMSVLHLRFYRLAMSYKRDT